MNQLSSQDFMGLRIGVLSQLSLEGNQLRKLPKETVVALLQATIRDYADTDWEGVISSSRFTHNKIVRHICFRILFCYTDYSLSEIGQMFNKDHATVMHGTRKVSELVQRDLTHYVMYNKYLYRTMKVLMDADSKMLVFRKRLLKESQWSLLLDTSDMISSISRIHKHVGIIYKLIHNDRDMYERFILGDNNITEAVKILQDKFSDIQDTEFDVFKQIFQKPPKRIEVI